MKFCSVSPLTFYVVLVSCPGSQVSGPQLSLHASSQNSCQCHCQTGLGRKWDGRPPDISQTAGALSTKFTCILMPCRIWNLYAYEYPKLLEISILVSHDENREDIYNKYRGLPYTCLDSITQLVSKGENIKNSDQFHWPVSTREYTVWSDLLYESISITNYLCLLTSFLPALFQTAVPAFVLYPEGISIPVSCTEMYTKKSCETRSQEFTNRKRWIQMFKFWTRNTCNAVNWPTPCWNLFKASV